MHILEKFLRWLGHSDRMGPRCGRDAGDLARDNSGAIMIAGTFMAALMAAGVFFIIGTGNAIVYRERLQDAADAVAFTSAGVHARGMNIIVLINLIMAGLLAVLILLRLIVVLLGIAIAACAACIAATVFCPMNFICVPAQPYMIQALPKVQKGADNYQKVLDWVLPALSKFEVVVALTTPYVGAYKGNKVAGYYKPIQSSGMAVSPSMVPLLPDGKRLGLPVQEMKWDDFCAKAATIGLEEGLTKFLPSIIAKPINWIAGGLIKAFSGYFCGTDKGAGGDFAEKLKNKIEESVTDGCNNQKKSCGGLDKETPPPTCTGDYKTDNATPGGCVSQYCLPGGGFDTSKCKTEGKDKANKDVGESGFDPNKKTEMDGGSGKLLDLKNKTPKEIWGDAEIGGIWFQVFGIVSGDEQFPRKTDKGIAIATKTGQMPKIDAGWGNWRLAQAEFYWDQPGQWKDNKEDSMWKMHWRARLRRFSISGINLGQLGLGKLFDYIKTKIKIDDALGKAVGGGSSILEGALTKGVYDEIDKKLKGMMQDWGKGVDAAVDGWAMPSWEIIH